MLQPFERFRTAYIGRLMELKKNYLVSQYYQRGESVSDLARTPLILSAYDDPGLAKTHWNAVKEDRYAAIIRLEKPEHNTRLIEILQENSNYQVYWAVLKSRAAFEKKVNLEYKDHMRRYIQQHTNWRIEHDASIRPSIELTFGHLYIILKRGSQTIRIKFEEIEQA